MIHELNGSVFSKDPINRVYDPMSPVDVQNTNYVMELKNREKYNPEDFDGSFWAWNLNKIKPEWYSKDLPATTYFENNKFKPKMVGDLKLKDGVKLK
jgi:hypothetical protein